MIQLYLVHVSQLLAGRDMAICVLLHHHLLELKKVERNTLKKFAVP